MADQDAHSANTAEMREPTPRTIPAGKVLLAECSNVDETTAARKTVLAEAFANGRTYRLIRSSAGFEPAGSVMRWTNGYYGVRFEQGGAIHGRQFKTEDEARELFAAWTERSV